MKAVLDAYAVIAALIGEPARREVEPHLSESAISAVNLAEVVDVCVRVHGNAEAAVRERLHWLVAGGLEVVPLDSTLAVAAGAFRARRYHTRTCEISLSDCVAAALAGSRHEPMATSDPHLAEAAWVEGLQVLALPDSRGRRPRQR